MLMGMLESVEISMRIRVISSLETVFREDTTMKHVICPDCGNICVRNGKTTAGSQRWLCRKCNSAFTPKIDNSAKQLQIFLKWLFGHDIQKNMVGAGRTFRRKTEQFWNIWPLPPIVERKRNVVYVDGIYLARKACILICCDKSHVLGWYLCRYEHSNAWIALMSRIAEPDIVVSDGGSGFAKALKKAWPHAKHQRCVFHAFSQVRRYTTTRPKTLAGLELYALSKDLLYLKTLSEAEEWTDKFLQWMVKHNSFLSHISYDEFGRRRYTHERLIKAQNSLKRLVNEGTMFTYLDESLRKEISEIPATNNRIEGGINSRLRAMLRYHRGLSIERRIKAVFWWCYMHSPEPLPVSEILKIMPTDASITAIHERIKEKERQDSSIPRWGDAVVWSELHTTANYPSTWD